MNKKVSEVKKGKGKQPRHSNKKTQCFIACIAVIVSCHATTAQEAVRASLAGEEAAEAKEVSASTSGYYNLHLGPTAWNFRSDLGIEANDNIKLESSSPESDFIFRPELSTRMLWPVSEKNAINFAVSAGYSAYVQHSELDRWFVAPGSAVSFDLYAGDFLINFHDRLSVTENSYQDPTVVGVGNYSQLQNDAGITTTWDLNKVVLKLGYDHVNYTLVSGDPGLPNGRSEVFYLSGGYTFRPGLVAGLELGGGLLHYSGGTTSFQDAADANAGAFIDAQLTEHAHIRANGGYTVYSPDASASQLAPSDFTGVYGQLSVGCFFGVRRRSEASTTLSAGRAHIAEMRRRIAEVTSGGAFIVSGTKSHLVDSSLYISLARLPIFEKRHLGFPWTRGIGPLLIDGSRTS